MSRSEHLKQLCASYSHTVTTPMGRRSPNPARYKTGSGLPFGCYPLPMRGEAIWFFKTEEDALEFKARNDG